MHERSPKSKNEERTRSGLVQKDEEAARQKTAAEQPAAESLHQVSAGITSPQSVLKLQRTVGNKAVQRLLDAGRGDGAVVQRHPDVSGLVLALQLEQNRLSGAVASNSSRISRIEGGAGGGRAGTGLPSTGTGAPPAGRGTGTEEEQEVAPDGGTGSPEDSYVPTTGGF